MLELAILLSCIVGSVTIGLAVYINNPRSLTTRLYAAVTLLFVCFVIANYISLHSSAKLFYIRLVVMFVTLALAVLYFLVVSLTSRRGLEGRLSITIVLTTILVAGLDMTPLVFSGLTNDSSPVPVAAAAAPLFLLHFVGVPILTVVLLLTNMSKIKDAERRQNLYVLFGLIPIVVFAPFTGFIMPVVLHNASFIYLSPVYVLFFVGVIGYAIFRHKMFDVRIVIVRLVAYLLTILTLATIFGLIVFTLNGLLLNVHLSIWASITISFITAIAALIFNSLKSRFDHLTNRWFYRDSYDSQALLDQLNHVFVNHVSLKRLVADSSSIIMKSLKAEFCTFQLNPERTDGKWEEDLKAIGMNATDLTRLYQIAPKTKDKVIQTNKLSPAHKELRNLLDLYGIALLCEVQTSARDSNRGLGYLILGDRSSGNLYSSKDIRLLEIITNELTIAIENSMRFEEIQSFSETLQGKVDEATKKLRVSNDKLKKLDENKDDFISMASHQLRTPLTSIKGYLSMVLEGDAGKLNAQQEKMLTQSYDSAQRMVFLISDLLNLSRLNTGKFIIDPAPVQLADIVDTELVQLQETANARQVNMVYERPENFPILQLDDTKIRQVIMNFMDNAVYYTPAGGIVTILLKEMANAVEYRVVDTGIGVPRAEQHRLFTKFYRADNAKAARPDGTGLGLFMAKKVIVASGGSIIFSSTESKGSTFGFRVPKVSHANETNTLVQKIDK